MPAAPTDTTATAAPAAAPADAPAQPQLGEQTAAQTANLPYPLGGATGLVGLGAGPILTGGSPLLFGGGSLENPCGFPGYGLGYLGVYGTYRFMLEHPTLRLARAIVVSPLFGSSWFVEHADEPPAGMSAEDWADAVDFVAKTFNDLRAKYLAHAVRCIDYGWSGFEVVWTVDDELRWTVGKLKPLLPDTTQILVDAHGNFAGLRASTTGGLIGVPFDDVALKPSDLSAAAGKAVVVTYDGEAGNLYDRPRLENVRRTAWKDWLDTAQQIQALSGKISGRQAVATVPAGGYTDPKTKELRSYAQDAADGMTAFAQGRGVVLTSPTLAAAMAGNDLDRIGRLSGTSPVTFSVIDFGTEAAAVSGLIGRLTYDDNQMFAGYLRSPRTGMESHSGSRADAEQHTDTGMADTQELGADLVDPLQPLVDLMARANWGLPPGTLRLRQSPLVDSQRATLKELLLALLDDPQAKQTFLRVADMDKVVDGIDVPRDGDWDEAAAEVRAEAEAAGAAGGPPGAKPSAKAGAGDDNP